MPLTEKGSEIMKSMKEQYGPERGERVFYASENAGTITGVHDMEEELSPLDCGDEGTTPPTPPPMDSVGGIVDQTGMVTQPLPVPEFEHPQLHPDASTPPEPALDSKFGQRDAAAGYGGVAGGVIPQGFDQMADALPSGMSLQDICRGSEQFWGPQWRGTE